MSQLLLDDIRARLARQKPKKPLLRPLMRRSAVALILQLREGESHILMIKRAEREGDQWSGHMAFPGGRMEEHDAHGFATAVRETEEEIGLSLDAGDVCIGRLSDKTARPRKGWGMAVSPFVFQLEREAQLQPNYEVDEVVWVPLSFLLDTANREQMVWQRRPFSVRLPCYYWEERCIWGLSLRMLDELLGLEGLKP
ncbi:NUDIX hydrolase [Mangrovimicrobium sediminis]|uniref:NUDIX hydrolase n=1 Tax=Mangrovimicrobium sediminis TaxID=2562682 RepID=UPI001F11859C|nr:CoA pyrophosphatase [Haliea sp. SAOS-164]